MYALDLFVQFRYIPETPSNVFETNFNETFLSPNTELEILLVVQVKTVRVEKKINEVVNRLNKTRAERKPDLRAEREERDRREREGQKARDREDKKRQKEEEDAKKREAELR